MDELLAIIGGNWQPLLLYPGVLTALLLALLVRCVRRADAGRRSAIRSCHGRSVCCCLPVAGQCDAPTPRSYWAYPLDLLVALALLEVPHWLRLAARMRQADSKFGGR